MTLPRRNVKRRGSGPRLARLSDWYMRRQLLNYQHQVRGTTPGDTYGVQMAPMANIVADPATRENVLAYIDTLPDTPAQATIAGDVENGRRLFETCQVCHGDSSAQLKTFPDRSRGLITLRADGFSSLGEAVGAP